MSEKSYVSLEQRVCVVCGHKFDTGSLLLDKRLRASMERHTLTGHGLCPEHQKLFDDGYIALVECDDAHKRTGTILHMRRTKFNELFTSGTLLEGNTTPFVHATIELIEKLKNAARSTPPPESSAEAKS